ncbi:hypothetical protein [Streptomyces sp. CB01881]|uniref:hypothetical protein n=1 Tax=Streptomyces sp. CB01881 TaxID=2078691 RepID=UPI000CDBF46F|nr:hypothetical protein [Streptomyces sp. CB01881]AUY51261.1 hypothetical protein C2142_22585 [Streptomyces sp. CB01881]TYC74647.1 hypothetical protein EH183_22560 [Streptomyces sp. CB01881]
MPGNTTAPQPRCEAAHLGDASPCEGPRDAVTVLNRHGDAAKACVHHGTRLYASLIDPRVRPVSVPGAATDVCNGAQATSAFAWLDHHQLPNEDER